MPRRVHHFAGPAIGAQGGIGDQPRISRHMPETARFHVRLKRFGEHRPSFAPLPLNAGSVSGFRASQQNASGL